MNWRVFFCSWSSWSFAWLWPPLHLSSLLPGRDTQALLPLAGYTVVAGPTVVNEAPARFFAPGYPFF
ncbi:hypothetical protein HF086_009853 [Spodoptera exigua]|uniref:Secreted protein n=1 Tax=Spodoptera exigua TaxID=7107 RepID=A0A922MX87_SPOEX|nr:hypothetical protein HF086_009853 [Spodoptera exigua]